MSRSNALKLLDLFRLFQRRQRYVRNAYSSELSGLEGFVVLLIHHLPKAGVVEISQMLGLDRSLISRTISSLVKRRYLAISPNRYDKRRRDLTLDRNGLTFFEHHLDSNRRFIGHILSFLTHDEQVDLIRLLKTIADTEGAPALPELSGLHPLMLELRRLTISHKIFSNNYLGSEFDTIKWQIFSEISSSSITVSPIDLSNKLGIRSNTLSQILDGYEEEQLIRRGTLKEDKRKVRVLITTKGAQAFKRFETHAEKFFKESLGRLSDREQSELVRLFTVALGGSNSAISSSEINLISDDAWCKQLHSEEEILDARGFLISMLLQHGEHRRCPERIISGDNLNFALFRTGKIRAICEISIDSKRGSAIEHISETDLIEPEILRRFVETIALELSEKAQIRELRLNFDSKLFAGKRPETSMKIGRITVKPNQQTSHRDS